MDEIFEYDIEKYDEWNVNDEEHVISSIYLMNNEEVKYTFNSIFDFGTLVVNG